MAEHNKVYGVCENKCLVPIYSQKEVDAKIEEVDEKLKDKVDEDSLGTQVTYVLNGTTLTITTK